MQTLTLVITAIFLSLVWCPRRRHSAPRPPMRPATAPSGRGAAEFEHREERDLNMALPGVRRATRFYHGATQKCQRRSTHPC